MIVLSQSAASEVRRWQLMRKQPESSLRLRVKTGGCSGLYYDLDLASQPEEGDRLYESHGISIVIDEQSSTYLQEMTVDYSEDLMGGGFRFHNSRATATCGCGHSFAAEV